MFIRGSAPAWRLGLSGQWATALLGWKRVGTWRLYWAGLFGAFSGFLLLLGGCGSVASRGINAEGVRLFQQSRYDEALQKFQKAIYLNPKDADGYYNLAATYHRLGVLNQRPSDLKQAEHYYHMCLDQNPDHRECYRGLAVLLVEQGRGEEAFRLLKSWADRRPDLADPKIELARLYEEFGDRETAKDYLVSALGVEPSNPRALAALGRLRELSGDTLQALADYQRSLEANRFQEGVQQRVAALRAQMPGHLVASPGPRLASSGPLGNSPSSASGPSFGGALSPARGPSSVNSAGSPGWQPASGPQRMVGGLQSWR
ncbi:MAG: tetratricopeptide repeat protein [Thermoguttaceae bacterium]|nr:tetratricopeptide repeat protein [Thermoguttaceae bacterium]MDW8037455.1 tetratricopeptide repeat protein [Thermoguttaceae bacterium]